MLVSWYALWMVSACAAKCRRWTSLPCYQVKKRKKRDANDQWANYMTATQGIFAITWWGRWLDEVQIEHQDEGKGDCQTCWYEYFLNCWSTGIFILARPSSGDFFFKQTMAGKKKTKGKRTKSAAKVHNTSSCDQCAETQPPSLAALCSHGWPEWLSAKSSSWWPIFLWASCSECYFCGCLLNECIVHREAPLSPFNCIHCPSMYLSDHPSCQSWIWAVSQLTGIREAEPLTLTKTLGRIHAMDKMSLELN